MLITALRRGHALGRFCAVYCICSLSLSFAFAVFVKHLHRMSVTGGPHGGNHILKDYFLSPSLNKTLYIIGFPNLPNYAVPAKDSTFPLTSLVTLMHEQMERQKRREEE